MYQIYDITDEASLKFAINDYMRFYSEERPQDKYYCKTSLEVRTEALASTSQKNIPFPKINELSDTKNNSAHRKTTTQNAWSFNSTSF